MPTTHYSKIRQVVSEEKQFCNDCMVHCYETYVRKYLKNRAKYSYAVVLDDSNFNSTKAIEKCDEGIRVHIAQHDKNELKNMMKKRPKNVTRLLYGDYSILNPPKKVVIDNADFCCGWKKAKNTLIDRLKSADFYADRAIVRLTLCALGSLPLNGTIDDVINDVANDYISAADETKYCVEILNLRQWVKNWDEEHFKTYRFPEKEYGDYGCYTYKPSMFTFMFLLIKKTDNKKHP
jgi:hypothetical protein